MHEDHFSVFIEQPELHLHPKKQSDLAQILIPEYNPYGANLLMLIETHSEHIIRKVQTLIAKGLRDHETISICYITKEGSETKIKNLNLNKNGFFDNSWPAGFFDNTYNLTKELIQANQN